MNYWDSVGRWINTLLVFIVGMLAFDTLFRLLEANQDNVIVAFVRMIAVIFLVPFQGMFGEQDYVLTTLVGVLGYALLAGIALGVLRSVQASRAQPAPPVPTERPAGAGGTTSGGAPAPPRSTPDALPATTDQRPSAEASVPAPATQTDRPDRGASREHGDADPTRQPDRGRTRQAVPGGNGQTQPDTVDTNRTRARRAGRSRSRAGARRGSAADAEGSTGS